MNLKFKKNTISKEKRRREKVKTAQDFAEKAVNAVETIKDTTQGKAKEIKDAAVHAAQEADNFAKETREKAQGVKKDIKDGFYDASQEMQKMAEKVTKDLKKP